MDKLKHGDFTGLAKDYAEFRPDYSTSVLNGLLGILDKETQEIDFLDVGAGTGIWTRMVFQKGVNSAKAVEPNKDMREYGKLTSSHLNIDWIASRADNISLNSSSVDWLTMASSFHWVDFERATKEFNRLLRPEGVFTALWNPRLIQDNPLLIEIEEFLSSLKPEIERVSSGRSNFTQSLTEKLWDSPYFHNITYIEGRHRIKMTKNRYLGAWKSVNDIRVQLGPQKFEIFLDFIERNISDDLQITTTYLTRAWSGQKKG